MALSSQIFLGLQTFDADFGLFLEAYRTDTLLVFFIFFTVLGSLQVCVPFLVALWFYWRKGAYRIYREALFLGVGIAQLVALSLKVLVGRPRPTASLLFESTASFPSGHAVIGVSLYLFLAWIFAQRARTPRRRSAIIAAGVAMALLIAFSRLYLGVHYLSDVVAGVFVGTFGLVISILYVRRKTGR